MAASLVFMYSGQGSQYFHMGAELFAAEPTFRRAVEECDGIIQRSSGRSAIATVYDRAKKNEPFDQLVDSHSALFTMEYALTQLVLSWGFRPSFALGYSIGELIAFTAAGGMSLEHGLQLAQQQAEMVQHSSPEAGMLAVLGPQSLVPRLQSGCSDIWLGACNFARHFVIVGRRAALSEVQKRLWEEETSSQLLCIRRGFHSGLIEHLELPFRQLASTQRWGKTVWPVLSCTTASELAPSEDHWWRVARQAVLFQQTIEKLLQTDEPRLYLDLGPSGTLAGFVKYALPHRSSSIVSSLMGRSGNDLDRVKKVRAQLEAWQRAGSAS